ncbi:hypothetical protein R5R35_014292 [Gryllus longicercus]|uniref:Glucosamine 6-phosphate N-acetyltransferase n=1 Tax=Gryllus longicercus TaxID=2509291 RepID=A0AAN9ZDY0_9ORTH
MSGSYRRASMDEHLYDPEILRRANFTKYMSKFNPRISIMNPGDNLLVRPLNSGDYDRGFLKLLSQLTKVGHVTREQFHERFATMKECKNTYFVTVIEDTLLHEVIGAATLVVEQKFLHDAGIRGQLEDVVVNNTYRGKQLGKLIVLTIVALAEHLGCYKIVLNCKDKLIPFYKSLGYAFEPGQSNNAMTIRFNAPQFQSNL